MYTRENTLAATLDTINKGIRYTAGQMDYADKLMREKAQSDLFYQEAQFTKDTQDFLRGLQQRNDYDNFQTDLDDYLTKKGNALQKSAHNAYTARLYDQMLVSQRNQLQNTVENMKVKMQYNEMLVKNESAAEMNRSSMQGQAAIDVNSKIYNSELANGAATFEQAHAKMLKDATENATKDVYNNASNLMESIFQKGGNFSDVKKYIEDYTANNDYSFKMLDNTHANPEGFKLAQETGEGWITFNGEVDKKAISDGVAKKLQAQWDAKVKEVQSKNFGKCTEWFGKMFELEPTAQIDFANQCIKNINTYMTGNNLASDDRTTAIRFFNSFADGKAGKGGKAGKDALDILIEKDMPGFIRKVTDEGIPAYKAKMAWEEVFMKAFREITNNPNATIEEASLKKPEAFQLLDGIIKAAPDEIKGLVKDAQKDLENILKDEKLAQSEELIAGYGDHLWDCLFAIGLTDQKALAEFRERQKVNRNGLIAKKYDLLRRNPKTGKLTFEEGVNGTDKTLAEFLYEAEQNPDYIYTNEYKKPMYSIFAGDGEGFRRAETAQKQFLAKNLGIDESTLRMTYESDGVDDVKSVQIFTAPNGTQYKVRSEDKKNLNIYVKPLGGNWQQADTNKQAAARTEREHKQETAAKASNIANNIEVSYQNVPPGIAQVEWMKHQKDKKWIAKTITDLMLSNEKEKDTRKVQAFNDWLEKVSQ